MMGIVRKLYDKYTKKTKTLIKVIKAEAIIKFEKTGNLE